MDQGGTINLWQARLRLPIPEQLAKILKGATGNNVNPEMARTLARRTLISTLENKRDDGPRHSQTLPGDRSNYLHGGAWVSTHKCTGQGEI
jgi:hypothetical protein